jgi:hypothetical protein
MRQSQLGCAKVGTAAHCSLRSACCACRRFDERTRLLVIGAELMEAQILALPVRRERAYT